MKRILERIRKLSLHTHAAISFIAMLAGGIVGWSAVQLSDHVNFVVILSLIAMIGGIVWYFIFVRCPHCGHHLNPRAAIPNFCPECGKEL